MSMSKVRLQQSFSHHATKCITAVCILSLLTNTSFVTSAKPAQSAPWKWKFRHFGPAHRPHSRHPLPTSKNAKVSPTRHFPNIDIDLPYHDASTTGFKDQTIGTKSPGRNIGRVISKLPTSALKESAIMDIVRRQKFPPFQPNLPPNSPMSRLILLILREQCLRLLSECGLPCLPDFCNTVMGTEGSRYASTGKLRLEAIGKTFDLIH